MYCDRFQTELNKWVKVDQFLLPEINKMLQKLEPFKSATALDPSLGFYSIPLDEENQKVCSTILPWGNYSYLGMSTVVACNPSMFLSIMTEILRRLDALVYIDVILVIQCKIESTSDHLIKVEQVLQLLEWVGFKANLRKGFFMQKSVKYLGYQLTNTDIGPQPKKVEAMGRILPPTSSKQLWRFLKMINFFRDVFKRGSHILVPLNDLATTTDKKKGSKMKPYCFIVLQYHIDAFNNVKDMIKT